ncbi:MAG: rhomboid family intramembrane serine protease [archaeon]
MPKKRRGAASGNSAKAAPPKRELPGREWLPLVTLYIFSITLFIYYLSVSFFPFVSPSYDFLATLGLHYNAPWSILTYMFIHLWPSHLLVDGMLLLVFGTIVERRIGGWKTLLIFLSSGFLGGLVNLLFFPTKTLIGSSGAVFGLIGAAVVLRPFLSMTLFVAAINLFAPIVVRAVDSVETAFVERIAAERDVLSTVDSILWEKIMNLSSERNEINRTISEKQETRAQLEERLKLIDEQKASGKISEAAYSSQAQEILLELSRLDGNITDESRKMTLISRDILETSGDKKTISTERREIERKAYQLSVTEKTREGTPEAPWPHSVGLIFGGCLVFFLDKNAFLSWEGKYLKLASLFVRRGKPAD